MNELILKTEKYPTALRNIKNYLYYDLIYFSLENIKKVLHRYKKGLGLEQENLAKSEETMQSLIINSIENFEVDISKVSQNIKNIFYDTLDLFFQLKEFIDVSLCSKDINMEVNINANKMIDVDMDNKDSENKIAEIVNQKLVEYCQKRNSELSEDIHRIRDIYSKRSDEFSQIKNILLNFNLI